MSTRTFFLYTRSDDVAASRRFYSDLIGLDQIWDKEDHIAYSIGGGVQFSISYDADATAKKEWSFQPGWASGLAIDPNPGCAPALWSIPLSPEAFWNAVARFSQLPQVHRFVRRSLRA